MPTDVLLIALGLVIAGLLVWDVRRRRSAAGVDSDHAESAEALDGLAVVASVVPMPLVVVDASLVLVDANAEAERELPALTRGASVADWSASVSEVLRRALDAPAVAVHETIVVGDPPRALRITARAWQGGAVATIVEATEEVDFEEARRTFSAAVSHELRTPLARVLGLAETLALPNLDEDRAEIVEQIETEVDGMRRLIDEMLLLAALDRGRLAVAGGVTDLRAVVTAVVDDARQRRLGRGRSIEVDAPAAIEVPVSERLCEVVVQNLVDNALLHGGPKARVAITVVGDAQDAVITVSDDGIGIPAQHLPFVFQRFYRGDASRTGPGSGLGLALVKHIVEAHGGSVIAESDGATGTTLRVRLPLVLP